MPTNQNNKPYLLNLYAGCGVGLAVAEDFVGGSGVLGGYILRGGGGYELRLTGEVLGGGEQIGIMWRKNIY